MQELINQLRRYGHLDEQQIELINTKLQVVSLSRGTYFSEAGKVANQLGFIIDGVMRVCYYNKDGEEFTRYFISENRFVGNVSHFFSGMACLEYVEALTDCQLLVLSKAAFTELADSVAPWNDIFLKMIAEATLMKAQSLGAMLGQNATTRYLEFLEQYPGLINRIPLSALASYLGMTQSSLSRIRKNIA